MRSKQKTKKMKEEEEDTSKIKEKIADKIGDIIYKKAKEDVKSKIRTSINNVKQKVRSFFRLKESQKQKIEKISTEIKEEKSKTIEDNVLGVLELYSIQFVKTMVFFLGVGMNDVSETEIEDNTNKEK